VRRRGDALPRFCAETRAQLPALAAGELSGWSARVVRAHLRRCAGCAAERDRQDEVDAALAAVRGAPTPPPPPGLLDELLERADRRGVRGRAAVPARGALSGARPALSVAFLTVGAVTSTGAGYAIWRAARTIHGRRG
jgi:anti-sigma factor RsiW